MGLRVFTLLALFLAQQVRRTLYSFLLHLICTNLISLGQYWVDFTWKGISSSEPFLLPVADASGDVPQFSYHGQGASDAKTAAEPTVAAPAEEPAKVESPAPEEPSQKEEAPKEEPPKEEPPKEEPPKEEAVPAPAPEVARQPEPEPEPEPPVKEVTVFKLAEVSVSFRVLDKNGNAKEEGGDLEKFLSLANGAEVEAIDMGNGTYTFDFPSSSSFYFVPVLFAPPRISETERQ